MSHSGGARYIQTMKYIRGTVRNFGAVALAAVLMGLTVPVEGAVAGPGLDRSGSPFLDSYVPGGNPRLGGHDDTREAVRSGQYVPLSSVLSTIRQRYPGKQLDTRQVFYGPGALPCYDIRWLTPDGRRLDFMVDARTGQIIRVVGL